MQLLGSIGGRQLEIVPSICLATLTNQGGGLFSLIFTASDASDTYSAVLEHCFDGDETPPFELGATDDGVCQGRRSFSLLGTSGRRLLPALMGRWLIESLDRSKGGRTIGQLDFEFSGGEDRMRVTGRFDLPILRIPAN